jgi:lysyl-tRNA synthetase class II
MDARFFSKSDADSNQTDRLGLVKTIHTLVIQLERSDIKSHRAFDAWRKYYAEHASTNYSVKFSTVHLNDLMQNTQSCASTTKALLTELDCQLNKLTHLITADSQLMLAQQIKAAKLQDRMNKATVAADEERLQRALPAFK